MRKINHVIFQEAFIKYFRKDYSILSLIILVHNCLSKNTALIKYLTKKTLRNEFVDFYYNLPL